VEPVPGQRPGAVTAVMPEQLPQFPQSPSWQAAAVGTHRMPHLRPAQDEAERPTQVMPWKTAKASGSRSLVMGIAAGLTLALVVVAAVVVARCTPDDGAPGARPGASAAPAPGSAHR
jgi:hypothetical protein